MAQAENIPAPAQGQGREWGTTQPLNIPLPGQKITADAMLVYA
jgi:hypothetical protein